MMHARVCRQLSLRTCFVQFHKKDFRAMLQAPHAVSPLIVWLPYIAIQLLALSTPMIPGLFRVAEGEPFGGKSAGGR